MKLKTVSAAKSKRIICDGCSKLEIAVTRKLVFNVLGDSVYMCDNCFGKLKRTVITESSDMEENKVIIEVTPNGWTETVSLNGKRIKKRYKKTPDGSEGLDLSWDYERISDDLHYALGSQSIYEIMYALTSPVEEYADAESN